MINQSSLIPVAGALLLVGCSNSSAIRAEGHAAGARESTLYTFEDTPTRSLPDGFEAGMTREWKATEWTVLEFEANHVLAHTGFWEEDPDGVFPVCWVSDAAAEDLTLSVRLYPLARWLLSRTTTR